MAQPQIISTFGRPPVNTAPSVYVRRLDHGLLSAIAGFAGGYAGASWLVWAQPLAGALDGLRLIAWWLSFGAGPAPEIWREMQFAPWPIAAKMTAMLAAGIAGGAFLGRRGLRPYCGLRHIAGPRLLVNEDAVAAGRRAAASEGEPFLALGPLPLAKQRWTRHMLVYGSVGSGKTQVLLPVLQQVIADRHRVLIYDSKLDMTSYFPEAALLSPWDARSRWWDISYDIRTPAQASTFASAIIPVEDGPNKYWSVAAQQLLFGTLRGLIPVGPGKWGWATLARRLAEDQPAFAHRLQQDYARAAPLIAGDGQAAQSVMATLAAYTRPIDDLAAAWGNGEGRKPWACSIWARDDFRGAPAVIMQAGPDQALTRAYAGAIVNMLVPAIMGLPDDELGRNMLFVLDEFPSLGRIEVGPLIDRGRSKGVSVVLGLQDLAQVRAVYGDHMTQAIQSMVGTSVVCRLQQGQTRDQVADAYGRQRLAITPHGGGPTHEETRAVITSPELSALGPFRSKRFDAGFGIRAIVGGLGADVLTVDFPGVKLARKHKPFLPAAWTLPGAIGKDEEAEAPPPEVSIPAAPPAIEGPAAPSDDALAIALRERLAAGLVRLQQ